MISERTCLTCGCWRMIDLYTIYTFLDGSREKMRYSYYFVKDSVRSLFHTSKPKLAYLFTSIPPSPTPEEEKLFSSLLLDPAHIIMKRGQSALYPGSDPRRAAIDAVGVHWWFRCYYSAKSY